MSFSAFSNEFHANLFTNVENEFIVRYLPWADGDAVRVYLYGLYLCSRQEDIEADSAAKLLKLSPEKFTEIYRFWEECGLVHILSTDPLRLEYLPVTAALGKPKPIRPEKYTEFNKELLRRLQRAGKDLKPYELKKIFDFLESSEMENQAFLLVVEYCVKKDAEKIAVAHILAKAKKLVAEGKLTYEQVENELADFNEQTDFLQKLFDLLEIYRKPRENDAEYLETWKSIGFEKPVILACAKRIKKGTMRSLDLLISELDKKGIRKLADAEAYLNKREETADLVFEVARKLGVKIENPRVYAEEYAEKWLDLGFTKKAVLSVSFVAFQLRLGFAELDELLHRLSDREITEDKAVESYCLAAKENLKLLSAVQSVCSTVKRTLSAVDMIAEWKSRNFSESLILEAAKRSAEASAPLSYMNRLLSEWRQNAIELPAQIPERGTKAPKEAFREIAIARDRITDREHFYAVRRDRALSIAENNRARAEEDPDFRESELIIKRGEIELAKAELYAPQSLPEILERMQSANERRKKALCRLGLKESDLLPQYACPKCSDSGFLPNGAPCDCYPTK